MKTATLPPLRVEPELREAAEAALREGESLSNLMEQSLRDEVNRRRNQAELIARGTRLCSTPRVENATSEEERKRNKPLFASRGRRDVVARGRRGEPIALGEAVSALARRLRNLTKLHAGATRPSRARCACLTRPPRRSRHLDGAHDLPNTEVLERASASARRSARQCPVGTERRSSAP